MARLGMLIFVQWISHKSSPDLTRCLPTISSSRLKISQKQKLVNQQIVYLFHEVKEWRKHQMLSHDLMAELGWSCSEDK